MGKIVINVPEQLEEVMDNLQAKVGYKISLEAAVHASVGLALESEEFTDAVIEQHEKRREKFSTRGRPKKNI